MDIKLMILGIIIILATANKQLHANDTIENDILLNINATSVSPTETTHKQNQHHHHMHHHDNQQHNHHHPSIASVPNGIDNTLIIEEFNTMKNAFHSVSKQMDKFNEFYLTNLDHKMTTILQTMSTLDTNIKSLQEKAQVWNIFQHHIDAWTDHMKSVDQKIDLIKRRLDDDVNPSTTVDNKLISLEFTINHILTKVDLLNEKFMDINKNSFMLKKISNSGTDINDKIQEMHNILLNQERIDRFGKKDILNKLLILQRQLQYLDRPTTTGRQLHHQQQQQQQHRNNILMTKSHERAAVNEQIDDIQSNADQSTTIEQLINLIKKLNNNFDRVTIKEFKQIVGNNKKSIRTLDTISDIIQAIDDRTVRLYDTNANQYKKLMLCCKATGNEVTTFTNSADLILKRIEKFVLNLDNKIDRFNEQCQRNGDDSIIIKKLPGINKTIIIGDDDEAATNEDDIGSGSSELPIKIDFNQPSKQSCHQIQNGKDGIYTFGRIPELNAALRNFNQRYCEFNTDGMGWLVLQRRGHFGDVHENFNRTWNEYKNGFGDLNKEFWFGNDFIHRLTYDDNVELRIVLEDWDGTNVWAQYDIFRIESEKYNYNLMISGFRGAVTDSMLYHNNQDFSTYDRINGNSKSFGYIPCSISFGSGWWFNNCTEANLNGIYRDTPRGHNYNGIVWEHWLGDYSLKSAKMMIRPRDLWFNDDETDVFLESPDDP